MSLYASLEFVLSSHARVGGEVLCQEERREEPARTGQPRTTPLIRLSLSLSIYIHLSISLLGDTNAGGKLGGDILFKYDHASIRVRYDRYCGRPSPFLHPCSHLYLRSPSRSCSLSSRSCDSSCCSLTSAVSARKRVYLEAEQRWTSEPFKTVSKKVYAAPNQVRVDSKKKAEVLLLFSYYCVVFWCRSVCLSVCVCVTVDEEELNIHCDSGSGTDVSVCIFPRGRL